MSRPPNGVWICSGCYFQCDDLKQEGVKIVGEEFERSAHVIIAGRSHSMKLKSLAEDSDVSEPRTKTTDPAGRKQNGSRAPAAGEEAESNPSAEALLDAIFADNGEAQ